MAGTIGSEDLRLQAYQDAQRLGVALEPTAAGGDDIECRLPVVPVRRVTDVVGQSGKLAQVRVHPEGGADATGDLPDLQGVGEPGAGRVPLPRSDDLGLVRQPTQRGTVQDARPVTVEILPTVRQRAGDTEVLRRRRQVAGQIVGGVAVAFHGSACHSFTV